MSQFDFDTRALVGGVIAQAASTAAALTVVTQSIAFNNGPRWAIAVTDSYRLIIGGIDAAGASEESKVPPPSAQPGSSAGTP